MPGALPNRPPGADSADTATAECLKQHSRDYCAAQQWLLTPAAHTPVDQSEDDWLRQHGYQGSPQHTNGDLLAWAEQNEFGWGYFCADILGGNAHTCAADPFDGNPNIYDDSYIYTFSLATVGIALGALGALACGVAAEACMGILYGAARAVLQGVLDFYMHGGTGALQALEAVAKYGGPTAAAAIWQVIDDTSGVDAAAGAVCNSFSAETRVLMADGSTKPISTIKTGDQVEATNPTTQASSPRTVIATIVGHDRSLTDLTVRDDQGRLTILHTTPKHPVWDKSQHKWTYAGQLRIGDTLYTATGRALSVAAVATTTGAQTMYNLTIATDHTYYVMAGQTAVLVHNAGPCDSEALDATWQAMGYDSRAQFGDDAWGGRSLDDAMSLATPEQVARMKTRGMTKDIARMWRDWYQSVYDASAAKFADEPDKINPSALARAQLFQYYMDNL
jgi:hypothetical protein